LYTTFQVLIHELAKFGIVGVVNFSLDVAIFNVLRFGPLHVGPLTSKAVSTVVAATSSYFMNRHWTFRHRARTGIVREYRLFILLSAIALGITETCLAISHYVLGLHSVLADNISANGIGLLLGMAFRFWSFKRWVFLPAQDRPAPDEALEREAAAVEETIRTTV
jgi:putative flippase GtrA